MGVGAFSTAYKVSMGDKESQYRDLVAKHLAKELSSEEENVFQQWLAESPLNDRLLEEATKLWKYSGRKLVLHDTSTQSEWERLKKSLENAAMNALPAKQKQLIPSLYWKIAASVIIAIGLAYFFGRKPAPPQPDGSKYTVYQTADSAAVFYLPDSTSIRLNVKSSITFLSSFTERTISLEGEGFFNVKHDASHVFTVKTANTAIQVLGTSFNVKAYEDEETVEVILVTGKVKFSAPENDDIFLSPDEKLVYRKKEHSLVVDHTDVHQSEEKQSENKVEEEVSKETAARELERKRPADYLAHTFTWKKNVLNQTIIEGTVTSRALHTAYTNVQLKVTIQTRNGRTVEKELGILGLTKVLPGATVPFKVSLVDVLSKQKDLTVEIKGAKPVEE